MNAYDKLLAQLHRMTASAERSPKKKHHAKAKPEHGEHHPPGVRRPRKKRHHRHAKHHKGRR